MEPIPDPGVTDFAEKRFLDKIEEKKPNLTMPPPKRTEDKKETEFKETDLIQS